MTEFFGSYPTKMGDWLSECASRTESDCASEGRRTQPLPFGQSHDCGSRADRDHVIAHQLESFPQRHLYPQMTHFMLSIGIYYLLNSRPQDIQFHHAQHQLGPYHHQKFPQVPKIKSVISLQLKNGIVLSQLIRRVLEARAEEIEQHHTQHQLGLYHNNKNTKGVDKATPISEAIQLQSS